MKLLVTGGCGFIGSNFIKWMLSRHDDVEIINVDNLSCSSNVNTFRGICESRHRFIKGDIADMALMQSLVREVDAVINLAAETHVDRSIANPEPFLKSNIIGAFNLLEAIRKADLKVRLIQVSTDEVYGDITEGSFKESDCLLPSNPYAASKASADMFCLAYHRTYNLDVTVTRCTNNFGPYQFPEKLIPKTIIRANLNLKVPVYGSGENIRDWIYVLDHCEALEKVLMHGRAGEIYNVSAGNEYRNLEVVERILEIMDRPMGLIELVEDRPGHDVRYSLDSSKIRALGSVSYTHLTLPTKA